jgi:23S rRNA (adenine2503-C2)-methyltransferase
VTPPPTLPVTPPPALPVTSPLRVRSSSPSRPEGAYDLSKGQLEALLGGEPAYRVRQVWDGLHRRALRPAEMTDLPAALRRRLEEQLRPGLTEASRRTADDGETVKWLWNLADGRRVETVLMAYPDRVTVCISTQAGCAMGCTFCATGQAGFGGHLSSGEIVEQVVAAVREARPRRVSNVVFMGMGEPLANYDRTWAAVERIHGDLGISARHLTLSTVGIVPGIRRLAAEALPVNLALSLHAANDELRDELVPVNRRYPLGALADACAAYVSASGRRLSIEWALIDGTNDRRRDMVELAEFARPLGAHVNLIPLNPTPGYPVRGTPRHRVREARRELLALGVNATVRATRGAEIDAACGQLAATASTRGRSAPSVVSSPR